VEKKEESYKRANTNLNKSSSCS